MIKNFSVSQLKTFQDCPRKWFDQYVLKKPVPPSVALTRGDAVHKATEARLLNVTPPSREYEVYVDALSSFFAPPGEETLVEHWMRMPTQFGIPFVGKIDYVRFQSKPAKLYDWKTTSDPRWILTPEEVREDIQTNVYAHYLFREGIDEPLEGGLIYVQLTDRAPKAKDKVKTVPRIVDLPRSRAERIWNELQPDLESMIRTAELTDRNQVTPKTNACSKYGGCPFRNDCGISPLVSIATSKGEKNMSFRDRLKNKQNGQTGAGVPATPPGQIVPPDAPPRTAGGADPIDAAPTTETSAEAPKRRGRKPKSETTSAPTSAPTSAAASTPASALESAPRTKTAPQTGMVLFVDCWPVKGNNDEITLFDDWAATMIFELNEWAESEKKVPHYQLLGFAEEKASVALAVQDRISKGLPMAMHVSTTHQLARDVLPMLLPHASLVVRALRS